MSKQKSLWCCRECGHTQPKWAGQCAQCSEWNSFHEEQIIAAPSRYTTSALVTKAVPINEVAVEQTPRIATQMKEFDRLLGGGIVAGSLLLVGGDPGIGKSTLLLQVSERMARQGLVVLYVCGEESVAQTTLRARRIEVGCENLLLFSETNLALIKNQIEELSPDVVVVDSIQIVYKSEVQSAPGSVSQVRECAAELMHLAKGKGISIFLIGHVTKSGEIAGPRVLEHLVDTVLYFEGDRQHNLRMMRVVKNRFGSSDEIAVFQMQEKGLTEISNPSEIFLQERMKGAFGSVVLPTVEGSRPILIEVQALVTDTVYSAPARRSAGIDGNRLALLLAVLEKRVGYQLHSRDVFVSVAGGLKITEPAIDLAILLAIASSLTSREVDSDTIVVGEVGLGGEVRSVGRIQERLKEAALMGFKRAVIPKRNFSAGLLLDTICVEKVEEAIHALIS